MKFVICVGLFIISLIGFSQDPQITQFYAAPLYLNPAFSGSFDGVDVSLVSRSQWSKLPGAYQTYLFSVDAGLPDGKNGVGIQAWQDRAGGAMVTTDISLNYAYGLAINDKITIRSGISLGYNSSIIDFASLTFLDDQTNSVDNSVDIPDNAKSSFFDVGFGLLAYSDNFWGGVSVKHLTQPKREFLSESEKVAMLISVHGGYKIVIEESKDKFVSLQPMFNYKSQINSTLDLGASVDYDGVILGVWYRGLVGGIQNALALAGAMRFERLKVGYSYDIPVSELAKNTGGSHEITCSYQLARARLSKEIKVRNLRF